MTKKKFFSGKGKIVKIFLRVENRGESEMDAAVNIILRILTHGRHGQWTCAAIGLSK